MLLPDQAANVLRGLQQANPGQAVIVVPLFLSSGYFTDKAIPGRLAGLSYRYNAKAILPSPFAAAWMERQVAGWLAGLRD